MTERKSLLARFDEEHIVKIATSPDDPERLFVDFTDSDGEMVGVKSLSVNGGYDYPKMHLKITNNSAVATQLTDAYKQSLYGMATETTSIGIGETKDLEIVYQYDTKQNFKAYYVDIATIDGYTKASDLVNCRQHTAHNMLLIDDPSLDSFANVSIT